MVMSGGELRGGELRGGGSCVGGVVWWEGVEREVLWGCPAHKDACIPTNHKW